MTEHSPRSKDLIKSGYLDWLCLEITNEAIAKFAAADSNDKEALTRAKVAYDMSAEVRQMVLKSARNAQK